VKLDWTCDCGCLNGTTNQVCRRCGAKPRCLCSAHNSDECICGAWDDMDPYKLKQELADLQAKLSTATACLVRIRDDGDEIIGGGWWCARQARVTLKEIGFD